MKKYILISASIYGYGGAQRYIEARRNYLRSLGWQVEVISSDTRSSGSLIPKDEIHYFQPLKNNPSLYRKSRLKNLISELCSELSINGNERVVIESISPWTAHLWGELLGFCIHSKHISQFIDECYPWKIDRYHDFYQLKVCNNEIFACSRTVAAEAARSIGLEDLNSIRVPEFPMPDLVIDVPDRLIGAIRESYSILCVSRLDKSFIEVMINDLIRYLNNNIEKSYYLAFVGDASDPACRERISNTLTNCPNLRFEILGFQPIFPRELFLKFDVAISKATSADICASTGIPTIAYHQVEDRPVGYVGYDIRSALDEHGGRSASLSELLDEELVERSHRDIPPIYDVSLHDPDFAGQDAIAFAPLGDEGFFDVTSVPVTTRERVTAFLRFALGERFEIFLSVKRRLERVFRNEE